MISSTWKGVLAACGRPRTLTPCAKPARSISKYQSPSRETAGKLAGSVNQDPADDVHHLDAIRGEVLAHRLDRRGEVALLPAGEDVHGGVLVLGPGVDHDV